jgi:hypothetical protein
MATPMPSNGSGSRAENSPVQGARDSVEKAMPPSHDLERGERPERADLGQVVERQAGVDMGGVRAIGEIVLAMNDDWPGAEVAISVIDPIPAEW